MEAAWLAVMQPPSANVAEWVAVILKGKRLPEEQGLHLRFTCPMLG